MVSARSTGMSYTPNRVGAGTSAGGQFDFADSRRNDVGQVGLDDEFATIASAIPRFSGADIGPVDPRYSYECGVLLETGSDEELWESWSMDHEEDYEQVVRDAVIRCGYDPDQISPETIHTLVRDTTNTLGRSDFDAMLSASSARVGRRVPGDEAAILVFQVSREGPSREAFHELLRANAGTDWSRARISEVWDATLADLAMSGNTLHVPERNLVIETPDSTHIIHLGAATMGRKPLQVVEGAATWLGRGHDTGATPRMTDDDGMLLCRVTDGNPTSPGGARCSDGSTLEESGDGSHRVRRWPNGDHESRTEWPDGHVRHERHIGSTSVDTETGPDRVTRVVSRVGLRQTIETHMPDGSGERHETGPDGIIETTWAVGNTTTRTRSHDGTTREVMERRGPRTGSVQASTQLPDGTQTHSHVTSRVHPDDNGAVVFQATSTRTSPGGPSRSTVARITHARGMTTIETRDVDGKTTTSHEYGQFGIEQALAAVEGEQA